jgi:hypothetical protein
MVMGRWDPTFAHEVERCHERRCFNADESVAHMHWIVVCRWNARCFGQAARDVFALLAPAALPDGFGLLRIAINRPRKKGRAVSVTAVVDRQEPDIDSEGLFAAIRKIALGEDPPA